jgi:general secretion pathway protein A
MVPPYCKHFGLAREPFNITPDPSFLYLSESHKEALAQLVYGIRTRRGFVVLTGEVGTGKTTLIQCLLDELNGTTKTALIFNMVVSPEDLLLYVCEKFDLLVNQGNHRDSHDYANRLERFLLESYQNGTNVALIIDEAQNLSSEVLENVRLLSNFETARDKLLQILLVGQPELGARLNEAKMRQIKQRVALRHHLSPLNLAECKEYIAKRLEIAGGAISLFTVGTIEAVHNYSGGIPRLINILCDNGLLTAYAVRKPSIESWMISEVAQDLQIAAPGACGYSP